MSPSAGFEPPALRSEAPRLGVDLAEAGGFLGVLVLQNMVALGTAVVAFARYDAR